MNTRSQVIRNTMYSSVGIYTEYILGMLTSIIIARHLGPADFGAYSLVIWLVAAGVVIANSGVSSAVIKFVAELRGANRESEILALLSWARRVQAGFLVAVLSAGVALFMLHGQRLMPDFDHGVLLAILVGATVLRAMYMLNVATAKGYENFRATAAIAVIVAPINLLMILLIWWLHGPVEWFLGSFTASSFIFWWISRRQVAPLLPTSTTRKELDAETRSRLRSYTALVAVTVAVSFITASEIEVLFLTLLDSPASAGQFKVAFQLSNGALLLVPGVFGALLLPMMAKALAEGREVAGRRLSMSTTYLAALAAPLVAYGVVFASEIIRVLYGAEFAPAATVFAICLLGGAVGVVCQGASSYLLGADRQRTLMVSVIAFSLVKVGLDVVLIHWFGLPGAAVAFAMTSTLVGALLILLSLKYSGATLETGRITRVIVAATLAGGVAWTVRGHIADLPTLVFGGVLLTALYAIGTLLLGFWSAADLQHFQHLHARIGKGRPAFVGRLLDWAVRRAEIVE